MRSDKKVQFVCFETTLDEEPFIKRWQQYTHSSNSGQDVTLQKTGKNGTFRYIAQHRLVSGDLLFEFSKEAKTSRVVQVQIKTTQAGGFAFLQAERLTASNTNERKVFIFLSDPTTDLELYKNIGTPCQLNIYEAYYENCKYAYVLEYFVARKNEAALLAGLNQQNTNEIEIYQECSQVKNLKNNKEKDFYAWPTF
ncbi:MAG: hypothetical protein ABIN25_04045 [Ginsengibacter sp.]